MKSELAYNLAIVFRISAIAYRMISEFFHFDTIDEWRDFTGKHLALVPFTKGAVILLFYYPEQRPKELKEKQVVTMQPAAGSFSCIENKNGGQNKL